MKVLLPLLLLALANPAFAQPTPKFEKKEADEKAEEKAKWAASGQVGMVVTSGNSQITTLTGGATASRKSKYNLFTLEAGGTYARSSILVAEDVNGNGQIDGDGEIATDSQTTAKNWNTKARYDYFFTKNNSIWAAGRLASDEIAGKDLFGGAQIGYARMLYTSSRAREGLTAEEIKAEDEKDKNSLYMAQAELGYDYTFEDYPVGDSLHIHSIRAFLGGMAKLSADTSIKGSFELLANVNELSAPQGTVDAFDDIRITAGAELNTKLYGNISFGFGFELKYDNVPAPRPGFSGLPYAPGFLPLAEKVDTVTKATLIITFL